MSYSYSDDLPKKLAPPNLSLTPKFRSPHPIELEFEKIIFPMLLFAKKRYAGGLYTTPDRMDYVDVKGLATVRRDSCGLVRIVSKRILDSIMIDKSPEGAIEAARDEVYKVLTGKYDMDVFVISKTLRSGYKNDKQPHVYVARKIFDRTGIMPHNGERIPYVFVKDALAPDAGAAERAEDPAWAAEHAEMCLDLLYYIDHQLSSPIVNLLELIVPDPVEAVFGEPRIQALMGALRTTHAGERKTAKRVKRNVAAGLQEITLFFKPAK